MKVASIILLVIGELVTLYSYPIVGLIGLVFCVLAIIDLVNNKKRIWVGVCAIIFTGLIGGIFYLCWKPDNNKKDENKEGN